MSLGLIQQPEHRQEQKTILSQRLIQSAELLQLPLLRLEERIDKELESNPVLELEESVNESDEADLWGPDSNLGDNTSDNANDDKDDFIANNYADTIDEQPVRSQNRLENLSLQHSDLLNNLPTHMESLQDHLLEQLRWLDLSPEQRLLCERIIDNISPEGYLRGEMTDDGTTKEFQLEDILTDQKEYQSAQQALSIVQSFDPKGVGARTIREALLLQVVSPSPYEKEVRKLITHHLEDLGKNRIPHISVVTGFSFEQIQGAFAQIRLLSPRPGSSFCDRAAQAIVPDIIVEQLSDGQWSVQVEQGRSISVNSDYTKLLKDKSTDRHTKEYLQQHLRSAQWLIDALGQRKATLIRVVTEIIKHQKDFLEHGPTAIKPLKLQQIADRLSLHVATVSRACDGKWMQTPQGIFPLKRFFTGSLTAVAGEETVAQDSVRLKLQELIDREKKTSPLSDEELVKLMEKEGIKISRRTITKYRKTMNIPDSRQRRVWVQ